MEYGRGAVLSQSYTDLHKGRMRSGSSHSILTLVSENRESDSSNWAQNRNHQRKRSFMYSCNVFQRKQQFSKIVVSMISNHSISCIVSTCVRSSVQSMGYTKEEFELPCTDPEHFSQELAKQIFSFLHLLFPLCLSKCLLTYLIVQVNLKIFL